MSLLLTALDMNGACAVTAPTVVLHYTHVIPRVLQPSTSNLDLVFPATQKKKSHGTLI